MTPHPAAGTVRDAPFSERLAVARLALDAGREVDVAAEGCSMGATIPTGVTLRLRKTDPATLASGDVISFVSGGRLVTHRVVARGRGARARHWLIVRGDARRSCDEPVSEDDVLGLVTSSLNGARHDAIPAPRARGTWDRIVMSVLKALVQVALEISPTAAAAVSRGIRRLRVAYLRALR